MTSRARSWAVLALLGLGAVQGCTPRQLFVLEAAPAYFTDPGQAATSVALVELEPTAKIGTEQRTDFRTALETSLADDPALKVDDSAPLLLEYRFVHLSTGEVPVRVISGIAGLFGSPFYGLGDGSVGVEVRFRQRGGQDAGRVVIGSPITGFFGSVAEANQNAAEDIALYLKTNYTRLFPATPSQEPPLVGGDEDPSADRG